MVRPEVDGAETGRPVVRRAAGRVGRRPVSAVVLHDRRGAAREARAPVAPSGHSAEARGAPRTVAILPRGARAGRPGRLAGRCVPVVGRRDGAAAPVVPALVVHRRPEPRRAPARGVPAADPAVVRRVRTSGAIAVRRRALPVGLGSRAGRGLEPPVRPSTVLVVLSSGVPGARVVRRGVRSRRRAARPLAVTCGELVRPELGQGRRSAPPVGPVGRLVAGALRLPTDRSDPVAVRVVRSTERRRARARPIVRPGIGRAAVTAGKGGARAIGPSRGGASTDRAIGSPEARLRVAHVRSLREEPAEASRPDREPAHRRVPGPPTTGGSAALVTTLVRHAPRPVPGVRVEPIDPPRARRRVRDVVHRELTGRRTVHGVMTRDAPRRSGRPVLARTLRRAPTTRRSPRTSPSACSTGTCEGGCAP
ncbi:hypothetical protein CELL_02427 [Cellulomonas sp. T2.31MG-18]